MALDVRQPAELVWSVAVADGPELASENLSVTVDGSPVPVEELRVDDGGRLHVCTAPPGSLRLTYAAELTGRATPAKVDPVDEIVYRRPSRYAESDELGPTAWAEFSTLEGKDLLDAVSSWVGTQLFYVSGSSRHTDGATQTLLARQGVCRDFAHLVIALLRARNVPARLVAVYAPGLQPMDFHAVVEAAIDGEWRAVDATTLAPAPVAGPDRHRPRRLRHGVPHGAVRPRRPGQHEGRRHGLPRPAPRRPHPPRLPHLTRRATASRVTPGTGMSGA